MATKFDITPYELNNSGYRIINIANEWVKEVDSIYAALAELNVSYKGEASLKFHTQLFEYRNDFIAARIALDQYVGFLQWYAREMNSLENNLQEQIQQLPVAQRHGSRVSIHMVVHERMQTLCGLSIREFSFEHMYNFLKGAKP